MYLRELPKIFLILSTHPGRIGKFELPKIDVYSKKFDHVLHQDVEVRADMKRVAAAVKNNEKIFPTLSDFLAYRIDWILDDMNQLVAMSGCFLTIACILGLVVAVIILHIKIRRLTAIITLASQVP